MGGKKNEAKNQRKAERAKNVKYLKQTEGTDNQAEQRRRAEVIADVHASFQQDQIATEGNRDT